MIQIISVDEEILNKITESAIQIEKVLLFCFTNFYSNKTTVLCCSMFIEYWLALVEITTTEKKL